MPAFFREKKRLLWVGTRTEEKREKGTWPKSLFLLNIFYVVCCQPYLEDFWNINLFQIIK